EKERSLLKQLRIRETWAITHNWMQALELLARLDNRATFAQLTMPGLHLLAEKDALVPVAAAKAIDAINPQQQLQVLEKTANALHWSRPQQVIDAVANFIDQLRNSSAAADKTLDKKLDKKKIAQSFSRAAETYDSVAQLQRDVGTEL